MKKLTSVAICMLLCATALQALAAVEVEFVKPENFTDISGRFKDAREIQDNIAYLRAALIQRGEAVLKPGQDMKITVTDVDLAGDIQSVVTGGVVSGPTGAYSDAPQLVRVAKPSSPPAVQFSYVVTEGGKRVREGKADIMDRRFRERENRYWHDDPLYYEKPMLDLWFSAEFDMTIKVARR